LLQMNKLLAVLHLFYHIDGLGQNSRPMVLLLQSG
jgi:hypothetical protein